MNVSSSHFHHKVRIHPPVGVLGNGLSDFLCFSLDMFRGLRWSFGSRSGMGL